MRAKTTTTIATYGVLGAVATVTFLLPGRLTIPTNLAADPPPDSIDLNGVLRDFHKGDPILVSNPGAGWGHVAGTVSAYLPGNGQPLFETGGYKVTGQYKDSYGRSIAPHLASVRGVLGSKSLGLRVNGKIDVKKGAIDAFNSNYGPYGVLGNFGADAYLSTNSIGTNDLHVGTDGMIRGNVSIGPDGSPTDVIKNEGMITGSMTVLPDIFVMPSITPPDDPLDLEDHEPALVLSGGSFTLTGDTTPDDDDDAKALWYDDVTFQDATVTIEGDLRIRCDDRLQIDKSQIIIADGGNLTFYVSGSADDLEISGSLINVAPGDTTAVSINYLGTAKVKFDDDSHVYATIVAPDATLEVKKAHFYGGYIGDELKLDDKDGGIHVDMANANISRWNPALTAREQIELDDDSYFDSFDSTDGPYGGANKGEACLVTTNVIDKNDQVKVKSDSTIKGDVLIGPGGDYSKVIKLESGGSISGSVGRLAVPTAIPVVAPPFLGSGASDVTYDNQTVTLSSNLHCKKLKIEDNSTVNISGHVTIRVDDKVEMRNNSHIKLLADSTLTLYVQKDLKLEDGCTINENTGDPKLVSVLRTSVGKKGKVEIKKSSSVYAWIQGAKTELKLDDKGELFGTFIGRKIDVKKDSAIHVDMAYLSNCVTIADSDGARGAPDNGAITSQVEFDKWYRNILGVNLAQGLAIKLVRDGSGVYEYLNDDFHPADSRMFGEEGQAHNNYFTYAIHGDFVYQECGGQFVELRGGDGVWLYVNDNLVIDLGGRDTNVTQYVEFDRLGLTGDEEYEFSLFYAQRQDSNSVFRIRTNIPLSTSKALPSVTAMFD